MPPTGANGGEAALRRVGLPERALSPARNRAALAQAAGERPAGADGGEAALQGVALPVVVSPPALDRAVLA